MGHAKNVTRRLSAYQTGCPLRGYVLHGSVEFDDRLQAERAIFRRCRGYRVGSTEWFQLHPDIALQFIQQHKQEIANVRLPD